MNIEKQILELGKKYLNLQLEISANQRILRKYEEDLLMLMKESGSMLTKDLNISIERISTVKDGLNATRLKSERPEIYEQCRKEYKRFNRKMLKDNYPNIFAQYTETQTTEVLKVDKIFNLGQSVVDHLELK